MKFLYGHKIKEITATIYDTRAILIETGIFSKNTESLADSQSLLDVSENDMVITVWDVKCSSG